jgi:hypothetical protein
MILPIVSVPHPLVTAASLDDASPGPAASAAPSPEPLCPEPAPVLLGGDLGATIAALAVQCGQEEQNVSTAATETQDSIAAQASAAEVDQLHEEASTTRAGAWASGLLQVGAGVAGIASAGLSIGAAQGTVQAGVSTGLKGVADGLDGAGAIAGGLSKASATDLEALQTASKALADAAQRSGAADRDGLKTAGDYVQAAIDFYREVEQTKAQAEAAPLQRA